MTALPGVPYVQPHTLRRARLFDCLDQGILGPLTTVHGPSGWGKSVLIGSWLRTRGDGNVPDVAWVSLDLEDRDPVRFWSKVLGRLRLIDNLDDPSGLAELQPLPMTRAVLGHQLLLGFSRLPRPLLLVLDDAHLINGSESADLLGGLMRACPDLHVILATHEVDGFFRDGMPRPGEVIIGPDQLRFRLPEVEQILLELRPGIEPDAAGVLEATGGWPAAVRLLSTDQVAEQDGVNAHQRQDRLVTGLLESMPAGLADFIGCTAVAETLTVDLAVALTGLSPSAARIAMEDLAERGAMTIGPGTERTYRLHDLLLHSVRRLDADPAAGAEQHRRCADWALGRGHSFVALRHAISSRDARIIAKVLLQDGFPMLLDRPTEIQEAVALVDPAIIDENPSMWLLWGMSHHLAAVDQNLIQQYLSRAERIVQSADLSVLDIADRTGWLATWGAAAIHARAVQGRTAEAVEVGLQVMQQLEPELDSALIHRPHLLGFFSHALGLALSSVGRLGTAADRLGIAVAAARRSKVEQTEYLVLTLQALVLALSGRLVDADRCRADASLVGDKRGWRESFIAAATFGAESVLAMDRGDLVLAGTKVREARRLLGGSATLLPTLAVVEARLDRLSGDVDSGLERLAGIPGYRPETVELPAFALTEAELHLAAGREDVTLSISTGLDPQDHLLCPTLLIARARLAAGDNEAAAAVALACVSRPDLHTPVVRLGLLLALAAAHRAMGDRSAAVARFTEALAGARANEVWRPFLDPPSEIVQALLMMTNASGPSAATAATCARVADLISTGPSPEPRFKLSRTEMEILAALFDDRTLGEIARVRHLSVNTVKSHVQNLYRKLGVTNRQGAVSAALRDGLIAAVPPP